MKYMHFKKEWSDFMQRHPKLMRYMKVVGDEHLQEGMILDLTVIDPDGKRLHANARMCQEDVALLRTIKELLEQQ